MENNLIINEVNSLSIANPFVTIGYTTEVKLKKNSLFAKGSVTKQSVVKNAQIGFSYENAVNNHLKAQGSEANFEAQSLPWGEWLITNKVIKHKDALYLRYYSVANTLTESEYYVNGKPATSEQIEQIKSLLPTKAPSGTQSAAGLVERQVKPQNVKFENITFIKINGKELR